MLNQTLAKELNSHSKFLYVFVSTIVLLVIWANIYEIDQVSRASGKVIASSRIQIIQAANGGVIEMLLVKEGDIVKKGQLLASLDKTSFSASVNELNARIANLKAQAVRLRANLLNKNALAFDDDVLTFPKVVELQTQIFKQRRQGFNDEMRTLQVAFDLSAQEADLVEKLFRSGDVKQSEVIRVQKMKNEAESKLVNRRNKQLEDVNLELAKIEDELRQNIEIRKQRQEQLENSEFRAAVPGIVKNVRVTTIGGVLRAGEELMQIIPTDDELIIEAKILPTDIAGIHNGLDASVRFDPFDFTIFGGVEGKVSYVSGDTLVEETPRGEQTYYRVHVKLGRYPVTTSNGKNIELLPGMTAQVDIRTGRRSVITYLLKPIRKTLDQALTEK